MAVSWKNKLVGAIATGAIVAGLFPMAALGAGASVLDTTPDDTATEDVTEGPGYTLTVKGLESGDTTKYYQIIEQDVDDDTQTPPYIGTQGWKLTEAVDKFKGDGSKGQDGIVDGTEKIDFGHKIADANGNYTVTALGLYVDELVISDYKDDGTKVTSDTRHLCYPTTPDNPNIVNALATAVAKNNPDPTGTKDANEDGIVLIPDTASGLYMVVATPVEGNTNYIYKPIFVAADYYNNVSKPDDGTHELDLTKNEKGQAVDGVKYPADYPTERATEGYASNAGVFKRSPLALDKKAGTDKPKDGMTDVKVGDTIPFTITVPIPTFTSNYVAPQFYITDTLTEGLKLKTDSVSVTVKNGDLNVPVTPNTDYKIFTCTKGTAIEGYENFKGMSNKPEGLVVQFLADNPSTRDVPRDGFLYKVLGAPTASITYEAEVTTEDGAKFAQQVNQMDNTAKLHFSHDPNYKRDGWDQPSFDPNEPDTREKTGELEDRTRHYTFDIDADVLGRDQSSTEPGPGGEGDESTHNKTSEIRKTWVDANGKIIQEAKTSEIAGKDEPVTINEVEFGWLAGAEFTLTQTKKAVTDPDTGTVTMSALETEETVKFDSITHVRVAANADGATNPMSDTKGYIAMKGLDAGEYILKEIKAPLGYTFNPNVQYKITITPTYVKEQSYTDAQAADPDVTVKATYDGKGSGDDLILDSYTVTIVTQKLDERMNPISGQEVESISTYNIKKTDGTNPDSILKDDGTQDETVTIDTNVETFGNNETALIVNKKLGLLPATGGSGIIFYLAVGGAVALVASYLLKNTKEEDPLA